MIEHKENCLIINGKQSVKLKNVFIKNLSDNDFKYLSEEFSGEFLELVKQNGAHPYEYMDSFKKFMKINYLIDVSFLVL